MALRIPICCAALALGTVLIVNPVAAQTCESADCAGVTRAKPTKPLDILKFMREQAASTRVNDPARGKARTAAHAPRPAHRIITARRQRAPVMPVEAASSFASQQDPAVEVVASNEFNAIDAAGTPAPAVPAETVGAAPAAEPVVAMAVADEFNDIDRKAKSTAAQVEQAQVEQAQSSWLHRIWSALGGAFTALATAVNRLIG